MYVGIMKFSNTVSQVVFLILANYGETRLYKKSIAAGTSHCQRVASHSMQQYIQTVARTRGFARLLVNIINGILNARNICHPVFFSPHNFKRVKLFVL